MKTLKTTIMKKCVLLLISLFLISSFTEAQYRINKTKYDYRTYSHQAGDKYNPTLAGFASIIPGVGQMISGEVVRGLSFLGGYAGVICTSIILTNYAALDNAFALMLAGIAWAYAIQIWSIVDATRVAKVNNLAFRDQGKTSFNLQIQPYFDISNYNKTGLIPPGITLKVIF